MTKNYAVKHEGRTVAYLQRTPGGVLLTPGVLKGEKLAELGVALENSELPEGFTLVEATVKTPTAESKKPNWKEMTPSLSKRQRWLQSKQDL
jgi:hypothetical protein